MVLLHVRVKSREIARGICRFIISAGKESVGSKEGCGDVSWIEMLEATWLLISDSSSEVTSASYFELGFFIFG